MSIESAGSGVEVPASPAKFEVRVNVVIDVNEREWAQVYGLSDDEVLDDAIEHLREHVRDVVDTRLGEINAGAGLRYVTARIP